MRCLLLILVTSAAFAQTETASAVMAKAAAAVERNLLQEKHWNWTTVEERKVLAADGRLLESLPSVTVESVIRSDGRRCVAVSAWGDGVAAYAITADADTRCGDADQARSPLRLEELLRSTRVKLGPRSSDAITVAISPDKSLLTSADEKVRCTASIRAVLRLDPETYFPLTAEGEVVEKGCEAVVQASVHYGEEAPMKARRLLHKGTTFQLEYALQPDKFGNPANSFWICVAQHWTNPVDKNARAIIYWNRRLDFADTISGRKMIQDRRTLAREFGVESQTRFDTVPKNPF